MMKQQSRFFYGWVVVAASALGLLFGAFPIVVSSFAIFFPSYLREFHAGRGAISLALMIHNLLAALLAAWIGRLTDRFGARRVILPGLGIFCLLLLSAKAIGSSLWHLYVFYALLGIVSDTTTSVPYGVVVCRWFNKRRGLAVGLTQAGLGLGAILAPPAVQRLIAGHGWRSAFAIIGGVMLVIPIPIIALFIKDAPWRMGLLPDGAPAAQRGPGPAEGFTWGQIRNSRTFWLMVAAFVLAG